MPQMFPLLWLFLFTFTAFALFVTMSSVHFYGKKPYLFSQSDNKFKTDHIWKW